jgi:site-specific DNA recombinase
MDQQMIPTHRAVEQRIGLAPPSKQLLGAQPVARATSETLAPGSKLSTTMRALSALDHRRRRPAPVRSKYDDGGLSGASLDRPALQQLLEDVRDGKIDVIVVRPADPFAGGLRQAGGVVRPQFEREVIGERVRDKIAASKRKGLWVGGPIPLGYATVNKKLIVVPEEAETVRTMFRLFLECGSVGALAEELGRRKIMSKVQRFASGRTKGGGPYSVGALAHFLKNRFYIGEVVYRSETHTGEHEPIVDRATFDAVQTQLAAQVRVRRVRLTASPAILMRRIFDDRGNRMTPSHSNKNGVRYRYYVSHLLLQRRKENTGNVARVPAAPLEKLVVEAVSARMQLSPERRADLSDHEVVDRFVARVVVRPHAVDIEWQETPPPGNRC